MGITANSLHMSSKTDNKFLMFYEYRFATKKILPYLPCEQTMLYLKQM